MNWKQIKKMKGESVELYPKALLENKTGERKEHDYIWKIQEVQDNKCYLYNPPYSYTFELPRDHIKEYMSSTTQALPGIKHGFFILFSQVVVTPNKIKLEPLKGKY